MAGGGSSEMRVLVEQLEALRAESNSTLVAVSGLGIRLMTLERQVADLQRDVAGLQGVVNGREVRACAPVKKAAAGEMSSAASASAPKKVAKVSINAVRKTVVGATPAESKPGKPYAGGLMLNGKPWKLDKKAGK